MNKVRFHALDSWRGVCALLVALYHLQAYGHFYGIPFVRNSWLFVDFFFVLSGFVISHAYMARIRTVFEFRNFLVRRLGRLWPLHMTMLSAFVIVQLAKFIFENISHIPVNHPAFSGAFEPFSIFTNSLLIQSFGIHDQLTWNYPSWSIGVEFYTYILFGTLLLLIGTQRHLILCAIFVSAIGLYVLLKFSPNGMNSTFDFGFFRCLYGFFLGHLTYRVWKVGYGLSFLKRYSIVEIPTVFFVIAFVSFSWMSDLTFFAPIVFALVIWVFTNETGWISRAMNARAFTLLGEWSYSIYMVHALILLLLGFGLRLIEEVTKVPIQITMALPWADTPQKLYFIRNEYFMDGLALTYLASVVALAAITSIQIEKRGQKFFNSFLPKIPTLECSLRLDAADDSHLPVT